MSLTPFLLALAILLVVGIIMIRGHRGNPLQTPPLRNHLSQPLQLPLTPSNTFTADGHTQPVFMLVKLPMTTQDGRNITVDADADTGSTDLVVVTTACNSCYCVSRQCVKFPRDAPQLKYPTTDVTYGQGTYPVKYYSVSVAGLQMVTAGIIGVGKGLAQVQSVCGLRPSQTGSATSLVDTVYSALSPGLPRSLVFDTVNNQLTLGASRGGHPVPLLSDSVVQQAQGSAVQWYVVQGDVYLGDQRLSSRYIILDTGTSVVGGGPTLQRQLGDGSTLRVELPGVTLEAPVGKNLFMPIPQLRDSFVVAGLNCLQGHIISFNWDDQMVYFS